MTTPRPVHAIVDQQIRRWMTEQETQRSQPLTLPGRPRPVVTVSREAGACGTGLGRAVADKLGFRLWDQELVQSIAVQSGASEALLGTVDERARGAIQDLIAGVLMGDRGTEAEYFASLLRVIHAVAQHGSAVIVGRGAQFVLPPERALRVRATGPVAARTLELAAARHLGERQAREEIERIDRERLAFVRHHFHRDAAEPAAYDLMINTAGLPAISAADVVVTAYRSKFAMH